MRHIPFQHAGHPDARFHRSRNTSHQVPVRQPWLSKSIAGLSIDRPDNAGTRSYHPQMALMESIFTRDYRDEYLASEYDALLRQVLNMAGDGTVYDVSRAIVQKLEAPPSEWRDTPAVFLRIASASGTEGPLDFLLRILTPEWLREDQDFIIWDRVCRLLVGGKPPGRLDVFLNWAKKILSEWSLRCTQPDLARLRREAAVQCYDQILQADEASSQQKAEALIARGWSYFLAGRIREAIADQQHAVSLAPANWRAHANLAVALLADGQMNAALAAYDGAFALATAEELPEIAADLAVALEKYGPIPEVDQIRDRIETRRRLLERERFRSPNKTTWGLREPS